MDEALFFTMGVGSLFPWNAFITESSYFSRRFEGTAYARTFESGFGVAYNLSNVISLVVLLVVQKYMTEKMLIVAPFIGTGAIFCATALLTLVDVPVEALFSATTATVLLAGIMAAPMISGVAGLAARFRKSCASAFFSGQAFGGVVASVSSLVTTGVAPQREDFCNTTSLLVDAPAAKFAIDWSAFWYFAIAALICFVSVAAYALVKMRQVKDTTLLFGADFGGYDELDDSELGTEDDASVQPDIRMEPSLSSYDDEARASEGADATPMFEAASLQQTLLGNEPQADALPKETSWDAATVRAVFRVIRYPSLAVLLTFFVTLSLFPALTAQTFSRRECTPGSGRFWNDLFVPTLFLCFNGADLVGRLLQGRWQPFSGRGLMLLALARVVFWPLFFFQHIRGSRLPPVLGADFFPVAASLLCGFTNGFVGTAAMVNAQLAVPMAHRDLASTIATICLTIGLSIGSTSSYLSVYIVQG